MQYNTTSKEIIYTQTLQSSLAIFSGVVSKRATFIGLTLINNVVLSGSQYLAPTNITYVNNTYVNSIYTLFSSTVGAQTVSSFRVNTTGYFDISFSASFVTAATSTERKVIIRFVRQTFNTSTSAYVAASDLILFSATDQVCDSGDAGDQGGNCAISGIENLISGDNGAGSGLHYRYCWQVTSSNGINATLLAESHGKVIFLGYST
jgi:hypothetical protein